MVKKFSLGNLKAEVPSLAEAFEDAEVSHHESLYLALLGISVDRGHITCQLICDEDGQWIVEMGSESKPRFKVIARSQQPDGEYLFTEQYCWCPAGVLRVMCLVDEQSQQEKDRRLAN